jgi:putative ABC transport system permease protein
MSHLRLALRNLRKAPFVSFVAVLSLALGIGANGAIFSLFDQMLLSALPVPAPERLVNLGAPGPKPGSQSCNNAGDCDVVFSYPMFRDLEREPTVLAGLAAHRTFGANLAFEGRTSSGEGVLVSGGYFPTLGLAPALGRLLDPGDDRAVGESRVVVLSHDSWRNRFGGDPGVVDRSLIVNGQALTIVGVAPAGFHGTTLGSRPEVFVPITLRGLMSPGFDGFDNRRSYWAYLFGRLAPGVTLERARDALDGRYRALIDEVEAPLQEGMSAATMERFRARRITVEPGRRGQSTLHREAKAPLALLFAVTGVVLLIACANIASLLLARGAARGGEMAVRLAVGARRRSLVGQLLVESLLLAAAGGLAGLAFARGTLAVIASLLPGDAAATLDFQLDLRVIAFAAVLALATGILFGLFPALHATRPDLATILKGQTGQPSGARAAARFRAGVVTAQIALATALLVSAGLFLASLVNIRRIDLGLEVDHLVTFSISPELNAYSPERSRALFARLEEELGGLPGVTSVAASMVPLLSGSNWGSSVSVEGFPTDPDTDAHSQYDEIGPGTFRTLGVPLLAGREFTAADGLGAPKVTIVNEAFAKKFGLGREAVGKRMAPRRGNSAELDVEIVGLVADAKYSDVKDAVPPQFFTPYRQDEKIGSINFYLRTALPPEKLLASIPGVVARLDPNLPVDGLKTMPQQVRENVFIDRLLTTLSAAFAVLATLLAAMGLYGVLAYTVAQRTREIGLRMALGADGRRVLRMVLAQVGRLTLVGGLVGLGVAIGVVRLAGSLLFGVEGYQPAIFAAAAALLALVALGAGLAPATRASRVDPMHALRYE